MVQGEWYVWSVLGQESVRLLFRLRTGSAGLLEEKKICRMVSDERCAMGRSRVGKDETRFLMICGEFERDQWVLLDGVCRIVGPENGWMDFRKWTKR